ncbi:MAG: hypothetical protein IK125_05525 [Lachnospiraceae bacterium]|nr:hypothetical protein [Lachnospiraceae bacterium]
MKNQTKIKRHSNLKKVLIVIGLLVLIGVIMFVIKLPSWIANCKYQDAVAFMNEDTGVTDLHPCLTKEQRIADFDYLYKIACLDNPARDKFEQAQKVSYEKIYNTYREHVEQAADDYEFFCYMTCFVAILPGEHNLMRFPNYARNAANAQFVLNDVLATQDLKDYTYSWNLAFRDDVDMYDEYNLIGFNYMDGNYIGSKPNAEGYKYVPDYYLGRLVSVDGKDPKDMCFEFYSYIAPLYDSGNECFYRNNLMFNDSIGIRHTAVIEMPDGRQVTTDLYEDPRFMIAYTYGHSNYPDLYKKAEEKTETPAESVEEIRKTSEQTGPVTYFIAKDTARKLVYVYSNECNTTEGEQLAADLKAALNEIDAERVILDIRDNGGGERDFCNKQLLPVLFSKDVDYRIQVIGRKNEYTKNYYESEFWKNFLNRKTTVDDEFFYYTEDFSVKGKAKKDYKIYLMTSQSSFSAADIITRICKEYDGVTIVGTNTGGEGICGSPFNCYLPESRFIFTYVPTVEVNETDDSYYGTMPDVYIHRTAEERLKMWELRDQGVEYKSYETRTQWDRTLVTLLEMIDKGEI